MLSSSSRRFALLLLCVFVVFFINNVEGFHRKVSRGAASTVSSSIRSSSARQKQSGAVIVPRRQSLRSVWGSKQDAPVVKQENDIKAQIKNIWTNYRYIGLAFYITLYITVLSSIFISLDMDLLQASKFGVSPTDAVKKVCDIVEHITGNTALPGFISDHPRYGTLAIAWVMTKFTEPIRLGITVTALPTVARLLGKGPATTPV